MYPLLPIPLLPIPFPYPLSPIPYPLSPLPSPLFSLPSPLSPLPSPLSPLPSPLSPLPSPLSPLPSPLSPLSSTHSVTIITDIVSCTIILLIPLFVITMWQLFVVYTNTTTIESMKKAWSTPIHLWPLQYWRDFKKGNSCNFSVFRGKRFGALLL